MPKIERLDMKLDIETVELVTAIRTAVNSAKLQDIQLLQNGKPVRISKKVRDEFEWCGLNNWDLFAYGFYKQKNTKGG